jgi:hypothetical protein
MINDGTMFHELLVCSPVRTRQHGCRKIRAYYLIGDDAKHAQNNLPK